MQADSLTCCSRSTWVCNRGRSSRAASDHHFADVRDRHRQKRRAPRVAKHYRPAPAGTGPSWLSFIGHTTDSLWSVDLFLCKSIVLRSYWVLVVMDQFTRRLIGVGVHCGAVTGADVCRMFNTASRARAYLAISVPITIRY